MTITSLSRQGGRRYRTMGGVGSWLLTFFSSRGTPPASTGGPWVYYAMQRGTR